MQQINLLQSDNSAIKKGLSFQTLSIVTIGLVAVLSATSFVQNWQYERKLSIKQQLQNEQQKLTLSIKTIGDQLQSVSNNTNLEHILIAKEKELANKTKVMSVLSGSQAGNTLGFADHFAGLSRQHINGLWITSLNISAGGDQMNIQGGSLAPEYVPQYLQRLGNEKSFQGLEFKHFVLERDKNDKQLDFSVYSNLMETS